MKIEEMMEYLKNELEESRKEWLRSQGNGQYAREVAEARYSYISMICNDLGIV